jgi:HEPN domain-containing protein
MAETEAGKHFMAFPAVVCAAFSAEVGLKTLLEIHGKAVKGHDLRALFLKLPDTQKLAVFEATELPAEEFGAQLAHSRLAFSEWRYIYEARGEKHINVKFLGVFATAVEKVLTQEREMNKGKSRA